ncbi:m05 protein [Murid betaherpesvirus 1]|nr:m05 protein [Murid betaherpesvirus 1]
MQRLAFSVMRLLLSGILLSSPLTSERSERSKSFNDAAFLANPNRALIWPNLAKCFDTKDATRFLKESVNTKTGEKIFTCMPTISVYANATWSIEWVLGDWTTWLSEISRFMSTEHSPPKFVHTVPGIYWSRMMYIDSNNTDFKIDKDGALLVSPNVVRDDLAQGVRCLLRVCLWNDQDVNFDPVAVTNLSVVEALDDFIYPIEYPVRRGIDKNAYRWPSETKRGESMSMGTFFGILTAEVVLAIVVHIAVRYYRNRQQDFDNTVEYRRSVCDPRPTLSSDPENIEILD